jgi:hypothetical protein
MDGGTPFVSFAVKNVSSADGIIRSFYSISRANVSTRERNEYRRRFAVALSA